MLTGGGCRMDGTERGVLVLGATGFIGRRVFAALADAGLSPVGAVRRTGEFARMFPGFPFVACDLSGDVDPALWRARLAGIGAVVNCAGVLADRHSRTIHVDAPKALHDACEQAGVRRVIHVSAISAEGDAGTAYAEEKLAAERDLRARDLDWVVLRPSLVYAEGTHGGTSALRGLAGFPLVVPLPGDGGQSFSPIHAEDLARAVVRLLAPDAPNRVTLAPCGPETMSLRQIVLAWRGWLGLPDAPTLRVPMALVRAGGRLADLLGGGPLSSVAVRQLEFGNAGDGAAFADAIGFAPRPMRAWLTARPCSVQDKWHARLFFLRPALRWVLGLSWIASGALGLFGGAEMARAMLAPHGFADLATPLTWATCLLDGLVGLAVLARHAPSRMVLVQVAIVASYTAVLSVLAPGLWLDPLGALLKNAAFLGLAAIVAALEDDR